MNGYIITYQSPSGRSDETFLFFSSDFENLVGVLSSDCINLVSEFFSRLCPGYEVLSVSRGELVSYFHGDTFVREF